MKHILNISLIISIFLVSMNISWQVSSYFNFYYSTLYSLIGIEQHINKYVPKNYNKNFRNFTKTTKKERIRLFNQIVQSINHHGKGLDNIKYNLTDETKNKFLTNAEILHLKDVSNMISIFNKISTIALLISIISIYILKKIKIKLYSLKESIISFSIVIVITSISILAIGPLKIFYGLHKLLFKNNKWFFYYEESLMTTFMKAPDIFGYIAIFILIFTFIIFFFLLKLIYNSNRQN